MELDLNDEQRALRDGARENLHKICPPDAVRAARGSPNGHNPEVWNQAAALGLLSVAVPEEHGGLGAGDVEVAVLLEEAGRVALPGPLLETCVAAQTIGEFADADQRRRWLPSLGDGTAPATVVLDEFLVAHAETADLAVLARNGELRLVPAADLRLRRLPSADGVRPLFHVDVNDHCGLLLARDVAAVERVRTHTSVAVAALCVGVAAQMVDMTVQHVLQRTQFGRPVGSFQAVKHRLAEAYLAVETTRTVVWAAAQLVTDHDCDAAIAASVAKVAAADAVATANQHALQCHGAIGFTVEHDLHLWLKLGKSLERAYGTAAAHRELIASAVLADQTHHDAHSIPSTERQMT